MGDARTPESLAIRARMDELSPGLRAFFEGELARAGGILARGADAAEIRLLLESAADRVGPQVEALTANHPPACAKGCSFCCRGRTVEVLPPDVLRIAEFLRETRTEEQIERLRGALSAALPGARPGDREARWRDQRPCVFLGADDACTIYSVRPLVCRLHNSLDASACARSSLDPAGKTQVPRHAAYEILYGLAQAAIIVACLEAGLDARSLELTRAVALALGDPEVGGRWARGERVFEPAVSAAAPREDVRRAPRSRGPRRKPL